MVSEHHTTFTADIRVGVGTPVVQQTVTYRLLKGQLRARRSLSCKPLTPNHYRLKLQWCQARAHWWRNGDLLCFLMKADSALVPLMAVCWLEKGQVSAWNYDLRINFLWQQKYYNWLSHPPWLQIYTSVWWFNLFFCYSYTAFK